MPKGHFPRSKEHRANISKALRGKAKSPEHIAKMSQSQRGKVLTYATRQKMVAAQERLRNDPGYKKFVPPGTGEKIRQANTGRTALLRKYGIDQDEYQRQVTSGNRWCIWKKHFASAAQFKSRTQACNECLGAYTREMNLVRMFGVGSDWYDAKLREQGGGCGICGRPDFPDKRNKYMCVDHDHGSTINGGLRGVLCGLCNSAIERAEVISGWIQRAVGYVSVYREPRPLAALPSNATRAPHDRRESWVRRKFGVGPEWYDAKLKEQNGCCSLCFTTDPQNKGGKHFAIDHSHTDGTLRGLLCSRCNWSMDRIDTVPDWGEKAQAYLIRYAKEQIQAGLTK